MSELLMAPTSWWNRSVALGALVLTPVVLHGGNARTIDQDAKPDRPALVRNAPSRQSVSITPVSGPSNLHRLALTVQQSSMGSTGRWGPAPYIDQLAAGGTTSLADFTRSVAVTGTDLYRLACRACHNAKGTGTPPEINTLLDPVQGASLVLWEQRMKRAGRSIDPAFARQVVSGARGDLLNRLVHGGQKMPGYEYLQPFEVQALLGYLELLADVPGAAERQRTVLEPPGRIGELLIKGTCHICHDASGPWPGPDALLNGATPSLSSLPRHQTVFDMVRKVRHGATVVMGPARMACRGRMPVFDYLSDQEVAAAYMYLIAYPPQ